MMKLLRPWSALTLLFLSLLACGRASLPTPTPTRFPTLAPVPTVTLPPTLPPIAGEEGAGGGGGVDLNVVNTTFLPRSDGWRLLGELVNNGQVTASNVSLSLEWFDPAGATLGADTGYPLIANIAPGGAAPFLYNIYDSGLSLGSFKATVSQFTATQNVAHARFDVEHAFLSVDRFGDFHCTGELVNNNPAPVSLAGLAATVLDRNNALVSADSVWAAVRHLAPGERAPFRISPSGFGGASSADHTCRIFIDGLLADPIDAGEVTVAGDPLYYVDAFGDSHLVGQIANHRDTPVSAVVVAGLYDVDGNVVDADFASPPVYIEPGQSLPFDFTTLAATRFNAGLASRVNRVVVKLDPSSVLPRASQTRLATRGDTAREQGGAFVITTEVVNDQVIQVDSAFVIARVVDGTNRLAGYGYVTAGPIPAGGAVSASIPVYVDPGLDRATLTVTSLAYAQRP